MFGTAAQCMQLGFGCNRSTPERSVDDRCVATKPGRHKQPRLVPAATPSDRDQP